MYLRPQMVTVEEQQITSPHSLSLRSLISSLSSLLPSKQPRRLNSRTYYHLGAHREGRHAASTEASSIPPCSHLAAGIISGFISSFNWGIFVYCSIYFTSLSSRRFRPRNSLRPRYAGFPFVFPSQSHSPFHSISGQLVGLE